MEGEPGVVIRTMSPADIPAVAALEREAFASEGIVTPFARELANKLAAYLVAEGEGAVLGYAGLWFIVDEAHLTSIAVRAAERRRGIGRRLLLASLRLALKREATMMTLEVRASNEAAQGLYQRFGFRKVGLRKAYYTEDRKSTRLNSSHRL